MGRIAPVMDQEFALADAAKAHARMEGSTHIGKIVLKVA
jgi:NADPH2:quinone reductase